MVLKLQLISRTNNRFIMTNQYKSTNSRFTFWFCFLLHLGLGGVLYHQILEDDLAKKDVGIKTEQAQQPAISIP